MMKFMTLLALSLLPMWAYAGELPRSEAATNLSGNDGVFYCFYTTLDCKGPWFPVFNDEECQDTIQSHGSNHGSYYRENVCNPINFDTWG